MKFDEMSDMSTILVEPDDIRSEVIYQVGQQRKPVVIVIPERACRVFQHPGHFVELRRLKRQRGLPITLVIMGHEQIRNYARRQGFAVYSSQETCVRALARRDRFYAARSREDQSGTDGQASVLVQEHKNTTALLARYGQFDTTTWYGIAEPLADGPLVEARAYSIDSLMLVLVVLLVLGILGGVGFGYLLSMVS